MDGNNWRVNWGQSHVPDPVMGGEAPAAPDMDAGDWRTQLPVDSRQRIVNKIMDTLTGHLPSSGQEGQQELKQIAIRFEEKTYASSTSQSDYLRNISSKMLTMETKSQNSMAISLQSNAPSNSKNPQDLASQRMQSQVPNQGQSNLNPLQPNSNVLPTQHVKQERQMFPTTQQQIKQQIQKRQILEQYMQRQQFIQRNNSSSSITNKQISSNL